MTTDDEGRVSIDTLPSGSVRLTAKASGFITATAELDLTDGKTFAATIREAPGVASTVLVVDAAGRPLPAARVEVKLPGQYADYAFVDAWGAQEVGLVTDRDGRCDLGNLPDTDVTLTVRWDRWHQKVTLRAGHSETITLGR